MKQDWLKSDWLMALAQGVQARGGRALLVGGCVRDGLLGLPGGDIDIEVYGLEAEALRAWLSSFGPVDESGSRYGVYTLRALGADVALPRRERRTGPLHGDFEVETDPWMTPEQAAARRDFTVNAILQDVLTGAYIDPFGGREDLRRGVLRAVDGGQFEEDPLRVLRGAQFASRFGLSPEAGTLEKMRKMPLDHLSAARVLAETKKALLGSDRPDVFFRVLAQANALTPWFGELAALQGTPQNPVYHPEGDAFEHTMQVLRAGAALRGQAQDGLSFMLACLTHDLGKAVCTVRSRSGAWSSVGHEEAGLPLIESLLGRLSLPRRVIAYAGNMCALHMRVPACFYGGARVSRTNLLFDRSVCPQELGWLAICDELGTEKANRRTEELRAFLAERLACYAQAASAPMPTADMLRSLGVEDGPQMGRALAAARRAVLCGAQAGAAARMAAREAGG